MARSIARELAAAATRTTAVFSRVCSGAEETVTKVCRPGRGYARIVASLFSSGSTPSGGLSAGPVIAIDGPSGSGKSSVSRAVAGRLGLRYLDTGAMYRALTWWCLRTGVDLDDETAVTDAASSFPLLMGTDPHAPTVSVDGFDVTSAVRAPGISTQVSRVARHLPTRAVLIQLQRDHIHQAAREGTGIVAEGRDLTTVVAPDADVRLLLSASEKARLVRRAKDVHGDAAAASIEATRDEVVRRDHDDSTVAAFLQPADGVLLLDTSDLDFASTVEAVLSLVRERMQLEPEAASPGQNERARSTGSDEGE